MWGRFIKRPELGFLTTAGGRLVFKWQVLEGVLEWVTLIIGLLVGVLTLIRLLIELEVIRLPRRRYRHRGGRRRYGTWRRW
jgi:hypothetical protein